jgi:phosphoadenosine phosphosulfate reductase
MSDQINQNQTAGLKKLLTSTNLSENLKQISETFPGKVVFTSSFSVEDQIITHLIFSDSLSIEVVTLDTGRLFQETYSTWSKTNAKYSQKITPYFPDQVTLENFVKEKGPNAFYESVENRLNCCAIRKIEPLKRAIRAKEVWITGIRSAHSGDRKTLETVEWDDTNKLLKFHPLLNWTDEQINQYVLKNNIIYNPLHDKGFVSIGCAPCTRAIKPGEDFRAGRWWWEDTTKKECGLHIHNQ